MDIGKMKDVPASCKTCEGAALCGLLSDGCGHHWNILEGGFNVGTIPERG